MRYSQALLSIVLLALLRTAPAQEATSTDCACRDGQGSYLWLRCPKKAPADPDPCPAVHDNIHPRVALPEAWNDLCFAQPRMACFLRRHAASWRISCSLCARKKCCPFPNWRSCPECHGDAREMSPDLEQVVELARNQKELGGKGIEVAMSPNFVLVTDLRSLKISCAAGGSRGADKHELLHLYLQRAEMARRDWEAVFGPGHTMRSGMAIVSSESTRRRIAKQWFGNQQTTILRGGGSKTIADTYGTNGFVTSGKNDDRLHFTMRHMIGHLLMSCYRGVQPHRKYLPYWLDNGCAHWLSKLHPRARDFATFCQHEGAVSSSGGARGGGGGRGRGGGGASGGGGGGARGGGGTVSGSGANWEAKAKKIARKGPKRDPVEAMFQASTAKDMDFRMHVRAWSWYEIFTTGERDAFVDFVQRLRRAEEPRVAAKAAWNQAPEIVDERWRERVLGKRREVQATDRERERETDVSAASARELDDIAREENLQLLASRIRGLERCQNVRTARLLVSLVDSRDSDRVREVIALVLGRTDDEKVLEYLRGAGYRKAGRMGRATLCRMFGELKDGESVELLRGALGDSFWLVKANAARALAQLLDSKSIDILAKMAAGGTTPKVRIACMDALAVFGQEAARTISVWERNLMHRTWQMKVATCDAFSTLGDDAAVEMLYGRLDLEGGRVHDDILKALQRLTGMEKDWKSEQWRKWWAKARKWKDLERRMKEKLEEEGVDTGRRVGDRYATRKKKPPTYYGIQVYARTVGYVLDVSASMNQGFRISPLWAERLGHEFKGTTRMAVCKEELAHSIGKLDPRTRLNIVFFNERARLWNSSPVPAAGGRDSAISAIKNIQPKGKTNYYDALRLILGMTGDGGGWNANFADTPDTLFFLTDGEPTDGEITKSDELLAWFSERNRFARLRVHVIAMGTTGVDLEFLRKLATGHGGKFVHLTGTY